MHIADKPAHIVWQGGEGMKLLAAASLLVALLGGAAILGGEPSPPPAEDYVLVVESPQTPEQTVAVLTEGSVCELPLAEYLTGVVMAECLPTFSTETLKAQAVAARTFAAKTAQAAKHPEADVCADPACCQAYAPPQTLREKLGAAYAPYRERAAAAVEATAGELLRYDGELIDAVYFSCSGGRSEPAKAVWGGDVPYLQSVESPGEEGCAKFESRTEVPLLQFRQTLLDSGVPLTLSPLPQDWFGEIVRSEGGGVLTAEIGGASFTGAQLRAMFALPSTNLRFSVDGGSVVIETRGYGHRVGMSQYGAEAMAQRGCDYRAILRHYYTGVQIG